MCLVGLCSDVSIRCVALGLFYSFFANIFTCMASFSLCIVSHFCIRLHINLTVLLSISFKQPSSFRVNWQDMVTEEIKSIFRKAKRQVDKPKI